MVDDTVAVCLSVVVDACVREYLYELLEQSP